LYHRRGDFVEAELQYRQALEIFRQSMGEDHVDCITCLNGLAILCQATGRVTELLPLMHRAAAIHDRLIRQVFAFSSDHQRIDFLRNVQINSTVFLSLVAQYLGQSPEAVHAALDLVLRRKALAAEALAVQRDAVLGGNYPALEPTLRQLSALRMQVA